MYFAGQRMLQKNLVSLKEEKSMLGNPIVITGGGIGGLAAALYLLRVDQPSIVWAQSARLGEFGRRNSNRLQCIQLLQLSRCWQWDTKLSKLYQTVVTDQRACMKEICLILLASTFQTIRQPILGHPQSRSSQNPTQCLQDQQPFGNTNSKRLDGLLL